MFEFQTTQHTLTHIDLQEEHNNAYPSQSSENNDESQLSAWVNQQRVKKKSGTLIVEREAKLNTINFAWDRYATSNLSNSWNDKFVELETWLVSCYCLNFKLHNTH